MSEENKREPGTDHPSNEANPNKPKASSINAANESGNEGKPAEAEASGGAQPEPAAEATGAQVEAPAEPAAGQPAAGEAVTPAEPKASAPAAAAEPTTAEQTAKEGTPPAEAPAPAAAAPAAAAGGGEAPAGEAPVRRKETDEEKAARRKAALEAREAAKAAAAQAAGQTARAPGAAAKAASPDGEPAGAAEEAPPKEPSPSQPRLDRVAALLKELVAEDAVEEAYVNEANDHLPTLVIKNDRWKQAASLFRDHAELKCRYLRNVSGVDYETYMEVVYYPLNMDTREGYCVKVRADREQPSVPSVTPIWETANWNEREIYDLLGVDFPGHPDLRRIMMPDDWVGHPLRKDYVPLDPEV